jgi:PTS hybrid protein
MALTNTIGIRRELVGIIIVAHSEQLAAGVCEVALQMAGGENIPVIPAGGTEDGRLGTSLDKVLNALQQILGQGHSALVLADLGSSIMVAEMALEYLPPEWREQVRLANAPLVEGALAAVVAASGGEGLEAVQYAAEQAVRVSKILGPSPEIAPAPFIPEEIAEAPEESVELLVPNPTGLHARPRRPIRSDCHAVSGPYHGAERFPATSAGQCQKHGGSRQRGNGLAGRTDSDCGSRRRREGGHPDSEDAR